MILLGFGVGAIASSFTVAYLSAMQGFTIAFRIAGAASIVGLIIISLLKPPKLKS